jgi:hypothetical protein
VTAQVFLDLHGRTQPWLRGTMKIEVKRCGRRQWLSTDVCSRHITAAESRTLYGVAARLTSSAQRHQSVVRELAGVATRDQLAVVGVSEKRIAAQLAASRWRRIGTAIVLHNGSLTTAQREEVAVINCGPRAVLTSFSAAARWGLHGWERPEIHVLAPGGTVRPPLPGVILHRTRDWQRADVVAGRLLHRLGPALVLAAASFSTSRPGCGLLAAAVQQQLLRPSDLRTALEAAPRARHRGSLLMAVDDIAQGAQALSEIDFVRLCRRYGLPPPTHQAVRIEPNGRRRYLDAEWRLSDGRVIAVEVDGAMHLTPRRWCEDQLRQNEVVLGGTVVLRYPSIVVRDDSLLVAKQLGRALGVPVSLP